MNKRLLVAIVIPLMLIPLASFAYAHWTDTVYKRYKFRFGTVDVEILKWHVDLAKTWDADSDGKVFGPDEEIYIEEIWGVDKEGNKEIIGLHIYADPVGPGFELILSMLIHNKGRLPVVIEGPEVYISGLSSEDPCFKPIPEEDIIAKGYWDERAQEWIEEGEWPPWLIYQWWYYAHDKGSLGKGDYDPTHYNTEVNPTARTYEPSEAVKVTQRIFLDVQPYPEVQCHYFRIDVIIPFANADASPYSSYEGTTPWYEEGPV